jgi:hypothetical protein
MTDPNQVWNNNVAFDPDSDMVSGADTDAIGSVDEMHYDADVEVSPSKSDDFYTDIDGSSTVLADLDDIDLPSTPSVHDADKPPCVIIIAGFGCRQKDLAMFPKQYVYDLNRRVRPEDIIALCDDASKMGNTVSIAKQCVFGMRKMVCLSFGTSSPLSPKNSTLIMYS